MPTTVENNLVIRTGSGFITDGTGFAGNGERQLLLSEAMVAQLKLGADCIGKKLSVTLDVSITKFDNFTSGYAENISVLDDDDIAGNTTVNSVWNGGENYVNTEFQGEKIKIFQDFVIMGIINKEYEQMEHNAADVWMTMPSLCKQNKTYLPNMSYDNVYNERGGKNKARIVTYQKTNLVDLSNQATDEGMVFPFFLRGGYVSETISKWSPISICDQITTYEVRYKNYKELKDIYTSQTKGQGNVSAKVTQDHVDMLRYDEEQKVIKLVLLIIGVIIGFITYIFSLMLQDKNKKLINSVLIGSAILSLAMALVQCFAFDNFGGVQNWNSGLKIIFYPIALFVIHALAVVPIIIKSLIKKQKEK